MRLPKIDARLVRTPDDVADFFEWLDDRLQNGTLLALDTETNGLVWHSYSFARLWQVGDDQSGWAIPVSWWGMVIHEAMQRIVDADVCIVMQNAGFDMHVFDASGWPMPAWRNVHDTKFLLHMHMSRKSRSLKSRHVAELLGWWVMEGATALKARALELGFTVSGADANYWELMPVDEPAYWAYGVMDTVLTRMLFDRLEDVRTEFAEAYEVERRYQYVMWRAEKRGVPVDKAYTEKLRDDLQRIEDTELRFLQSSGIANPNSPQQVVALLEEEYGFVPWTFTDNGNPSIDKKVLEVLSQAGEVTEEVVLSLVKYKQARKWRVTYAETFLNRMDHLGFIHPSINTMAASTGRSSINGPALQTLPSGDPLIRDCLLAPKGTQWFGADYSNQEPRLLAHYGGSVELINYFTEGEGHGSVHDFVAGEIFGPGYDKGQRSVAKVFGLSRSYGAGAGSMAVAAGMSKLEVEKILPKYDRLMGLDRLKAMIEEQARLREPEPYIVTVGGRRVYSKVDETFKLVNFLMQGSGADMLKAATLRLDDIGLSDYILFPVHDEICFALPKGEGHLAELFRATMVDDSYLVPMPVDLVGPGDRWGDLYR